jgi:hypothetical protein
MRLSLLVVYAEVIIRIHRGRYTKRPKSYAKEPEWFLKPYFRIARFNERIVLLASVKNCSLAMILLEPCQASENIDRIVSALL